MILFENQKIFTFRKQARCLSAFEMFGIPKVFPLVLRFRGFPCIATLLNSTTELICVHAYLRTSKHFMCYLQTSKIAISSTRILCWLMRTRTGKKVNQLNNKIHLSIDKKNLSPFCKKELRKSMCSNVGHHIF